MTAGRRAALAFVFLWFAIGGAAHFVFTEAEMRIVPPWFAWPHWQRFAVLASGVAELAGAAGLLHPRTRRAAGWALVLVTLAVTPAHIWMLQVPERFPAVPLWALWLRLPVQVALLALILFATQRRSR